MANQKSFWVPELEKSSNIHGISYHSYSYHFFFPRKRNEIWSRQKNFDHKSISGELNGYDKNFVGPLEVGAQRTNFDISNENVSRFGHNWIELWKTNKFCFESFLVSPTDCEILQKKRRMPPHVPRIGLFRQWEEERPTEGVWVHCGTPLKQQRAVF